ncbi:MAG: nitroreductase family protein [Candidatus Bathyarchaeia archaeon]|jgi:nitroreductase
MGVFERTNSLSPSQYESNHVFEAIETNIAVRKFSRRPLEDTHLLRILEAARLCQSGKNLQPWYFIVIKERSTLEVLSSYMKGDVDEIRLKNAPVAIAVISDPVSEFHIVDCGRAIQNMTLAAWEMGIGSAMISGLDPPNRQRCRNQVKSFLGVPEKLNLLDLIIFGYRKRKTVTRDKRRKKLSEIVFLEKFGNTLNY